ncbi:hypothetical protein NPIL_267401 [Nephila pilipes]|uniref:Uncharacterized protein n=1 Tax=Nephila pilipes TaxID=299642 RepID=A0A8X6MQ03_NEPPI|nr:hypothetical protein NPIL_267401 [Nephila pilipes]
MCTSREFSLSFQEKFSFLKARGGQAQQAREEGRTRKAPATKSIPLKRLGGYFRVLSKKLKVDETERDEIKRLRIPRGIIFVDFDYLHKGTEIGSDNSRLSNYHYQRARLLIDPWGREETHPSNSVPSDASYLLKTSVTIRGRSQFQKRQRFNYTAQPAPAGPTRWKVSAKVLYDREREFFISQSVSETVVISRMEKIRLGTGGVGKIPASPICSLAEYRGKSKDFEKRNPEIKYSVQI